MRVNFTCHDIAFIQFRNTPSEIYTQLVQTFPSYIDIATSANPDGQPVLIEFVEDLALPAGAQYISSTAAYTKSSYYLLDHKGHSISIDLSDLEGRYRFHVSRHIAWELIEDFIEILLHALALNRRKAFFHSGAIGVNGKVVVLCGWANIGKTESIVEFLRRGYAYFGDDWVIIGADGTVCSYAKTIALHPHDIAVSPELIKTCYGRFKGQILSRYCQLHQPSKVKIMSLGLKDRSVRLILLVFVRLLHLPMSIQVKAEQITPNSTLESAPLKAVYFMSRANVSEISIKPLQLAELISKMTFCYRYETRLLFDLEHFKFAFPMRNCELGLNIKIPDVKKIWSKAFSCPKVKLYGVQIPESMKPKELVTCLEKHIQE